VNLQADLFEFLSGFTLNLQEGTLSPAIPSICMPAEILCALAFALFVRKRGLRPAAV
jgi:hypothetical protein